MDFLYVDHYKLLKSARSVIFTGRSNDDRKEKHHFLVSDFYPYFAVPWRERNTHRNHSYVVSITSGHDIHQNKVAIIKVKRADHVPVLRDDYYEVLEAKILFHDRVRIDLGIKSGFTISDNKFNDGVCFSCGNKGYHKISHQVVKGW